MDMNRYLFDTNAVVSLLSGNESLLALISDADWVGISVITKLEFLSFPGIQDEDVALFAEFESRVEVIDVANSDMQLINESIRHRREKQIKLPDALIIASGRVRQAFVVTADRHFCANIRIRRFPSRRCPAKRSGLTPPSKCYKIANSRQALLAVHLDYAGKHGLDAFCVGATTTIKRLAIWKLRPTNQGFIEAQNNRIWERDRCPS